MLKRGLAPLIACVAAAPLASAAYAAPQTYHLEKTHVDLLFAIDHAGFSKKHGSFRELDATLQFDPAQPEASSVDVVVQTDSLDTGFAARDKDVKGAMFLDVAQYPQMHFRSTHVRREGDHLRIDGELTLHGVTRPLTLTAHVNQVAPNPFDKRPTVGFSATGSLKRSDFGIKQFVPVIGDEVAITIDAEFNHAA